jgi:hypothetical protein
MKGETMKVSFLLEDENGEQHFTVRLDKDEVKELQKIKEENDVKTTSAALKCVIEVGIGG